MGVLGHSGMMTQSEGGKEIHKFVKDSSEALKVSKVAANWKAYVDFVTGHNFGG